MLFKGIRDGMKSKELQDRAECIVDVAERKMSNAKSTTMQAIEKLGEQKLNVYSHEVKAFVDDFTKIKNIEFKDALQIDEYQKLSIDDAQINEMSSISLTATDTLKGLVTGVGAGTLVGWGTYGGVMALGTASTGAAISGLSGAAATNATLAWLGGGAVAAGGGGIALGSLVLGGLVAGPALLIAGCIVGAKGRESLNNAKSNLSAAKKFDSDVNVVIKQLEVIQERVHQISETIEELRKNAALSNIAIQSLVNSNTNWESYSIQEKETVFAAFKTIQLLKNVVEIPLLSKDGSLTKESENIGTYVQRICYES